MQNETYEHEPTIALLGAAIKVATDDGNYEPAIDFIHDGTCRVCVNAMTEAVGVIVELEERVRELESILSEMMECNPPFRATNIGAPGSLQRQQQERQIVVFDRATAALKGT